MAKSVITIPATVNRHTAVPIGSYKKRDGFNKMVEDALSGAIDLIITKSVSRFARNTVDSLTTIRKLKENRVECYFEKKDFYTGKVP